MLFIHNYTRFTGGGVESSLGEVLLKVCWGGVKVHWEESTAEEGV